MKNIAKHLNKLLVVIILAVVLFSTAKVNTVDAKSKKTDGKILFTETITIDNETSHFTIGFVRVDFKKNAMPEEMYPLTFEVELYAEDGDVYIEFSPDVEEFLKDVKIHVHAFEGFIYDVSEDDFIYLEIPNFVFKVSHFSRWCFIW